MTNSRSRSNGPITYSDAGVDIDAGNALVESIKPVVKSTFRSGALGEIGGFGGLFDLKAAGFADPILVAATDGVGTKLKIAIETGNHETIGIDLVAMCVNDLIVQGAEPLFFLDYFATEKLEPTIGEVIIKGIAEGCRQAGCALIGGETAEMPGMYAGNDYDLAGFSVGAVERDRLLPRSNIEPGDQLIALSSSGLHSNGFSLVRKLVGAAGLEWGEKAPWHVQVATELNLAQTLLTPTKIYVKPILELLSGGAVGHAIKALVHITGGGLTENIPRVLPNGMSATIDLSRWSPPPVFGWLAQQGQIDDCEMLRTFNCGIGLVLVIEGGHTKQVCQVLTGLGESPFVIGEVSAQKGGAQDPPVIGFSDKLEFDR